MATAAVVPEVALTIGSYANANANAITHSAPITPSSQRLARMLAILERTSRISTT